MRKGTRGNLGVRVSLNAWPKVETLNMHDGRRIVGFLDIRKHGKALLHWVANQWHTFARVPETTFSQGHFLTSGMRLQRGNLNTKSEGNWVVNW